jgi:hypothetical protein
MNHFFILLCSLLVIGCQVQEEKEAKPLFWGFALEGYPITVNQIDNVIETTQVVPHVIEFYLDWTNSGKSYESLQPTLEAIGSKGMVPCLTWEPKIGAEAVSYEDILKGNYDAYIDSVAEDIKLWGNQVILRFAHEMNLSIYHWGTDKNGYDQSSPEIYQKIFRYVADNFKKKDVVNVSWVFCPNADSIPNESWNIAENYYPGDAYVDILGMDGYNWGGSQSRSFEQTFKPLYKQLKKISANKPIIVFETASVDKKVEWIKAASVVARQWKIECIIWFQVKKEKDWRLL